MKRIITISRELGSGGRTIGKLVANRLGIPYYDRELIDEAANVSGLSPKYIEENEQRVTNSFLYNVSMGGSYAYGILESANKKTLPLAAQIYCAQQDVIKKYANAGKCVIVGRCADDILKDRDDVLHIFVYADMDKRIRHCIEAYGMSESAAQKN